MKNTAKQENGKAVRIDNTLQSNQIVDLLKTCTKNKDLHTGATLHVDVLRRGFLGRNPFITSSLVNMYAKCGAFVKAKEVLEGLPVRDVASWSALIAGFMLAEYSEEALACFEQMHYEGVSANAITYVCALKACGNIEALDRGKNIHSEIDRQGLLIGNAILGGALIDMYATCGDLVKARQVLEELPSCDVASWNALIARYVHREHGKQALDLLDCMLYKGVSPNAVTFACGLKACGIMKSIDKGKSIHSKILDQRLLIRNVILGGALVDMYAKCGALVKAKSTLDALLVRNVVSWNALIAGYMQGERNEDALNCFHCMQHEGISPDSITFTYILKACGAMQVLDKCKIIHSEIVARKLVNNNIALGNALVDMYFKCFALMEAEEAFECLSVRNVVSWSVLIAGYVEGNHATKALDCCERILHEGLLPNTVIYTFMLKACSNIGALEMGRNFHRKIIVQGLLVKNVVLGNALVNMYAQCGTFSEAKRVLEQLPLRDELSWSALITGFLQGDHYEEAFSCSELMQFEGIFPDAFAFTYILKACGNMGVLDKGENIHSQIVSEGLLIGNVVLGGALVDMYMKCGVFGRAVAVFEELSVQNVVLWNTLVTGYVQKECCIEALNCFVRMQCEGHFPDGVTFVSVLNACSSIGALDKGGNVHSDIVRYGLLGESISLGNALVDLYAKCGAVEKAKEVLQGLPVRDVVSWNALITGYLEADQCKAALIILEEMQCEGLSPDIVTFIGILKACGSLGTVDRGKIVHCEILRHGLLFGDIALGGALVDMYAKCGILARAHQVLEGLLLRNVVSWNALIAGYAQGQYIEEALNCFEQLQLDGFFPDEVTFISMLTACSHVGDLNRGGEYFALMSRDYGISPNLEHHTCMINLFAHAGLFDMAFAIIEKLPFSYHPSSRGLLTSCKQWGNAKVGRQAFDRGMELIAEAAVSCV